MSALSGPLYNRENHPPNKLLAYMFALKKSQSPDRAPSGVRHDMFVVFMTCFR
jgi:hypothetical protein